MRSNIFCSEILILKAQWLYILIALMFILTFEVMHILESHSWDLQSYF